MNIQDFFTGLSDDIKQKWQALQNHARQTGTHLPLPMAKPAFNQPSQADAAAINNLHQQLIQTRNAIPAANNNNTKDLAPKQEDTLHATSRPELIAQWQGTAPQNLDFINQPVAPMSAIPIQQPPADKYQGPKPSMSLNDASKYDPVFQRLYHGLTHDEAGMANLTADPGGVTNHGLSTTAYLGLRNKGLFNGPDWPTDVTKLTPNQREEIFYYEYYLKNNMDKFSALKGALGQSQNLMHNIYTMATAHGGANSQLQKTLNELDPSLHLQEDGILGSRTVAGMSRVLNMASGMANKLNDALQMNMLRYLNTDFKKAAKERAVKRAKITGKAEPDAYQLYIKGLANRVTDYFDSNPTKAQIRATGLPENITDQLNIFN